MDRTLGVKYPISMGTALVFEGPEFDIRKWPNLLYVNLRTLYRNYVASISKQDYDKLNEKVFMETFLNEVSEVERIVKEVSGNRVKVFFFLPHYNRINKSLPQVEVKEYNPDMFDLVEEQMWDHIRKSKIMIPFFYQETKLDLPKANEPTLLWSSFAVDLLSASQFPLLLLLESYTGKIKKRQEWYTKIRIGKAKGHEDTVVPFNKFSLQVFGDKSGFLKTKNDTLRSVVRNLAKQDKWTPVTGIEKIRYSISKIKDSKTKELLYSYL